MNAIVATFLRMLAVAATHTFLDDGYFGVSEMMAEMDLLEAAEEYAVGTDSGLDIDLFQVGPERIVGV